MGMRTGCPFKPRFDLDVRTFVAVAQADTLTAAAKGMNCPASTLSRALTRLEKHLGVLLVERGPRGPSPDRRRDGVPAIVQTRDAEPSRHGRDILKGHRSCPSGLLKVACPVTMARDTLAPLRRALLGWRLKFKCCWSFSKSTGSNRIRSHTLRSSESDRRPETGFTEMAETTVLSGATFPRSRLLARVVESLAWLKPPICPSTGSDRNPSYKAI